MSRPPRWGAGGGGGGGGGISKADADAAYQQKQLTRALGRLYGGLAARTTLPCRLAFTGSSTTAGTAATTAAKRYVNLLVSYLQGAYPSGTGSETTVIASGAGSWGTLSNAPGVHGYNAGKGGTTAATYLDSTATAAVISLNPRMVLHMVGSNDFKNRVPVATYKSTVAAKIAELKAGITGPCVHLLVQPYERFDTGFTPVAPWADYGRALAEIAAADPDNVAFLDISAPYYPVGVPGSDPLDLIDTDSVHQTDAGHAFMADLLRQALTIPQITTMAVVDTVAPTVPANLTATSGNTQVALTWSASTDNVAVTGYRIRRDGTVVTTATGTSYTDTGLTNGTSYSYTVAAYDAAGNESAQSTAATGLPAASSDTQAPTVPGTPTATAGTTSATASTTGSTDNVGVTGYRWYRGGNQVGSTTGTSFTETGLPAGTPVSYTVAAIDAAGNLSAQSAASNAVTPTAAASNLALDTFTDGGGKSLLAHTGETNATWTQHPSTTTDYMQTANNRIFQTTTGSTQRYRTPAVGTADYTVELDIVCLSQQSGGSLGVFARLNNAAARSAYYVQYQPSTGVWTLYKVVSDTTTALGTAFTQKLTAGQSGRAAVTCKGSTISGTVTIDNVTTDLGTVTDTSIADPGTPGFFSAASSQTSTTGHHMDNYRAVAA